MFYTEDKEKLRSKMRKLNINELEFNFDYEGRNSLKIFPQLILLCGGYGKRARTIYKNKPKILFPINGKPFIYWILKNLENKGIKKIILCTGYKSNLIQNYIKKEKKTLKLILVYHSRTQKN